MKFQLLSLFIMFRDFRVARLFSVLDQPSGMTLNCNYVDTILERSLSSLAVQILLSNTMMLSGSVMVTRFNRVQYWPLMMR